MKNKRIAIIGAGPAGLTAALAAHKSGLEVAVFEQAPDFKRIGGGILIHSNGLRVLNALDLKESFEPFMRATQTMVSELPGGKRLSELDYSQLAVPYNYGAVVLRYQLQEHLLRAAERAGSRVQFDHCCQGFHTGNNGAVLKFDGGREYECDIIVGCDGLHSKIREATGLPTKMKKIGEAYLRGIANLKMKDSTIREIWGSDGRRFGICPLPEDQSYFFCSVPFGEWNNILHHNLEAWIESWKIFGPDVVSILNAVEDWHEVNYSELYEVEMDKWWKLPAFIVGDAAHAMTPNFGQGANSAMVDALVLMKLLAETIQQGGDLNSTGQAYDSIRHPFVAQIQQAAHQMGMIASWKSPPAQFLKKFLIPKLSKIDYFSKRAGQLLAGYNPAEEVYFNNHRA